MWSAELQTARDLYLGWEQEKIDDPVDPTGHALDGRLLVSLTSHRPRLKTLHLTIKSLLEQTVLPDRILIWLTREDKACLPPKEQYSNPLVAIETCDDLRSYKKLIPALLRYPDATIVTVDDDAYYHRRWLETLVESCGENKDILCHVAYRIHFDGQDRLASYGEWTKDVQDRFARHPSSDLLPIGVGGVLYPPGSLAPAVTASRLFTRLCPDCDDLWFYVMAKLKGTRCRKVGPRLYQTLWPGSQQSALWVRNVGFNNDRAIERLVSAFGADVFR